MHFWEELHQFLQVYTAEKNNFQCNLRKISKSLKYNMNGIIQRTFKKAEQDPYGSKEGNMHMVELRLYFLCYATEQVNVPTQFYDLGSKNTFPGIYLTMSQLPSSVEVLTNVRQGPQTAEIATVTKLYTKLQAMAEADYLKYISASFYQMVEPA